MLSFKSFSDAGQLAGGAYATDDDNPPPQAVRKALGVVMIATGKTLEIVGGIGHSDSIRNAGIDMASKGQGMLKVDPDATTRAIGARTKQAIGRYVRQAL